MLIFFYPKYCLNECLRQAVYFFAICYCGVFMFLILVYSLCYTLSQKVCPFYFCDYSVKGWPISIIFGSIAAEKISKRMTYSFLIISRFMCEYYRIEKREIFCMLSMLPLRPVSFLQFFQKFVQSVQSPTFIHKFQNKSLCSITF